MWWACWLSLGLTPDAKQAEELLFTDGNQKCRIGDEQPSRRLRVGMNIKEHNSGVEV